MRAIVVTFLLFFTATASAQDYSQVRSNLEGFVDQSIEVRSAVMPTINEFGYDSYQMDSLNQKINFRDSIHLQYVISILEESGWLGTSVVGKKANISLFLAIQHAPRDLTRERYFPMLEASAKRGESSLSQMATMQDRIAVSKKMYQRYGTQWNLVNNTQVLYPIEEVENINLRRKAVGLESLSDSEIASAQTKYQ